MIMKALKNIIGVVSMLFWTGMIVGLGTYGVWESTKVYRIVYGHKLSKIIYNTDIYCGPATDLEPRLIIPEPPMGPQITTCIILDEESRPINLSEIKNQIGFPKKALEEGIQGDVVVRVQVSKYGNYISHKILKQGHPILEKAVKAKIHLLKFTPAIRKGKPINSWINIPFRFLFDL